MSDDTSGSIDDKSDAAKTTADAPALVPDSDADQKAPAKADKPATPGLLMLMEPRAHRDDDVHVDARTPGASGSTTPNQRRVIALAAVAVLAMMAGALGAVTTASLSHGSVQPEPAATRAETQALQATIAKLQSDLAALRGSVDHAAKASAARIEKANDRFDRLEKAQAEPAAKLKQLSDTVEKIKTAAASPPPAPAPAVAAAAPAREVTGTVAAPAPAQPKVEVGRLPTIEGWVLRDAAAGGAVVQSRRDGIFEVYVGDPLPGLGRVDAIRKQDGRWVVVTAKGLIVAR